MTKIDKSNFEYVECTEKIGGRDVKTLSVDIVYPSYDLPDKAVYVGLLATRASDGILVTYDMERDGYVIYQESALDNEEGGFMEPLDDWKEVAFIKSWARNKVVGE